MLWIATFAQECSWTIVQAVQQRSYAGKEQPAAYWLSAALLLGGHVTVSLALRQAVLALRNLQFAALREGSKLGERRLPPA